MSRAYTTTTNHPGRGESEKKVGKWSMQKDDDLALFCVALFCLFSTFISVSFFFLAKSLLLFSKSHL